MTKPHSGHGHDHGPHSGHEHHERTGHEDHGGHAGHMGHCGHGGHGDHVAQFRRLFWVNLVLAVPVVAFSPMFAMILGYSVPGWATWIAPVIGTVMYVWGGSPFLTGTVSEIKARKPGMMLLIALGITVAFLASWGATLGLLHHELEFWWELALLVVIMLLGHWIEMRSLAQTTSALDSLAALLPDEAERVEGETAVTVSPAELRVDDLVIVRPGGSVPADGMIVDGRAAYRKMKQNLWWAAGYNLISLPLAAGVLARVGFGLPMSVGAILMSLSTIVVSLNAQLLRRIDLSSEASTRAVLERTN